MDMNSDELDRVFGALSDATRRGMLAQLSKGEANVSALAAPYAISQPAASKHVRVLEKAGLVEKTRRGREQFVRVAPGPLDEAGGWIAHYAAFWRDQFDAVDAYLAKAKERKR
jgi:DNA-binding transcriptional ArsR family regulator